MRGSGSRRKLPSGSWRAKIYIAGRELRATFPSASKADDWLKDQNKLKAQVEDGTAAVPDPVRKHVTVAELAKEWLEDIETGIERKYTERTRKGYRLLVPTIVERFGLMRATQIREKDVRTWIGEMRAAGKSASTIRHHCDRLSQILAHGARTHGIVVLRKVPRPVKETRTPRTPPGKGKLDRWLSAAPTSVRLALLLTADAGLRRGECCLIRGVDLSLRPSRGFHGWIRLPVIDSERRTKSGNERWTPITTTRLADSLARFKDVGEERVLPLTPDGLSTLCTRALGCCPFHSLRHGWATRMIAEGYSIRDVQQWLGHASIETTQRYAHPVVTGPEEPMDAGTKKRDRKGLRLVDEKR